MPTPLTFGYLYDFRNPAQWRRPWETVYAEILEVAAWSETVGFGGAWVPEHHLADDGYMPSPLVALAAIAARTSRIALGSAVALAPLYPPVRFAQDCAVLDILAGGRLEMALAIGYRRRETAAHGIDFTRRGRLFDEWLDIVTRLWAGETVSHDGAFFHTSGALLAPPAPRGRIPLYLGGFANKAIARVIRHGDGYLGEEQTCRGYLDKLAAAGGEQTMAKVRITGLMTVVARDPEAAREELAPYFHHVNNSYGEWFHEDKALGLDTGFEPMSLASFKAAGIMEVLTPEAAIAKFRSLQAAMPLEHYMMMMPPGLPAARFVEYAQLFADEVIPAFA
jgi:alkanesulfonate monooxygenase SsuD/methylene tetrahydromethanopterin reductase-like flavin-dependent oxidoreductase (luciferase family)